MKFIQIKQFHYKNKLHRLWVLPLYIFYNFTANIHFDIIIKLYNVKSSFKGTS